MKEHGREILEAIGIGRNELVLFLGSLGFGVLGTVVWVLALVDCAWREPSQGREKTVWVLVIAFTHLIGALLYLALRRPRRIAQYGM